jgi:hypothetical protein
LNFGRNVGEEAAQVKRRQGILLRRASPPANSFRREIEGEQGSCGREMVVLALTPAALPSAAAANVIWPAAILTERLLAWWIIGVSLVIEYLFVWLAFRLPAVKTAWATLAANAVSAGIGLFLVPFLGILFEASLQGSGIAIRIDWDAFSPAGWIATFLMAVGFNLAIELAVFRYGYQLALDKRVVGLIVLANAITVGLALASLQIVPHEHY